MAKRTIYTCDRCDREVENAQKLFKAYASNNHKDVVALDLCGSCDAELKTLVKNFLMAFEPAPQSYQERVAKIQQEIKVHGE